MKAISNNFGLIITAAILAGIITAAIILHNSGLVEISSY